MVAVFEIYHLIIDVTIDTRRSKCCMDFSIFEITYFLDLRMINTSTSVLEPTPRISPSLSPLNSMASSQHHVTSPQNLVTSSQLFVTSSQNQLTSQPLIVSSSSPFIAGPLNGNSHVMRGFQTPFLGAPTFLPNHRTASSPVLSSPKSGTNLYLISVFTLTNTQHYVLFFIILLVFYVTTS